MFELLDIWEISNPATLNVVATAWKTAMRDDSREQINEWFSKCEGVVRFIATHKENWKRRG
jgi:hypothetical protein